ncbi:MAG: hypothetical protein DMG21_19330 [Acidobacteria bacterium]|nr:MAG: hypothetical protein DMG21_19330 [Acidobacteriota bacterium]
MSARDGWALVTGASSGIGESFARLLAARGRNVILVARSEEMLQKLRGELTSRHGVRAEVAACDLSAPGAAGQLAKTLGSRGLRPVELLINNAGSGARGEFHALPLDGQEAMLRLNIQSLVELTYLLLPQMVEARRGGIVNVSSLTSFQPVPYAALYAASKAFVTSFSLGLAEELRPSGIPVVTLCPGGTRTNFVTIGQPPSARRFPGGRQDPDEVAALGLRQLERGGGLVVPRLVNKATVFAQRFLPLELVPRLAAKLQKP